MLEVLRQYQLGKLFVLGNVNSRMGSMNDMVTYFKYYKALSSLSPSNNVFIRGVLKHSIDRVLAAAHHSKTEV
jgi:hypothetical protein